MVTTVASICQSNRCPPGHSYSCPIVLLFTDPIVVVVAIVVIVDRRSDSLAEDGLGSDAVQVGSVVVPGEAMLVPMSLHGPYAPTAVSVAVSHQFAVYPRSVCRFHVANWIVNSDGHEDRLRRQQHSGTRLRSAAVVDGFGGSMGGRRLLRAVLAPELSTHNGGLL